MTSKMLDYGRFLENSLKVEEDVVTVTVGMESVVCRVGDLVAVNFNDLDDNQFSTSFVKSHIGENDLVDGFVISSRRVLALDD